MPKFYNVAHRSHSKFSKKIFFILFCFMGILGSLHAQVSVTATLVGPGPVVYTTLKGAFDAINAGTHTGAITISITGNTLETATALLNSSGAPSSYSSIVIRPNAAGRVITGTLATAIVKLNGADNVTFDGFTGAGPSRDLTISNTNASTSSAVIWVASASGADGATNDTIRNCIVTGNSGFSTLVAIAQSSGTTLGSPAETANSNNTYTNNLVSAAQYGIGVVGATGNEDANTVISFNEVGSTVAGAKMGHAGLFIAQQKNVVVSTNKIAGVNGGVLGSLSYQASGIYIGGTIVSGGLIEKNQISDIKINSVWGCNGIQLNSSSAGTGLRIVNNFIWDVAAGGWTDADTVDDNGFGIAVVSGSGYQIIYNSINMATNQGTATCKTAAMWIGQSIAAGALDIRNNIFVNAQTTANRWAIYSNSASTAFTNINFNDYYSLGSVGFLGASQASLANWQTATGQDGSSVAVNPVYTTATNLHLFATSPLDGLATPIAGITKDIDADTRNVTTPDMGADEFTPPNCTNPVISNFPASASITDICASGSAVLTSSAYSYGLGISYQWEQSVTSTSAGFSNLGTQVNPLSGNTGVITQTHYYRLRVQCSGGAFGYSLPITITVNNPAVTSPTGGTRCGVGTVSLSATGTNLKWYAAATGGAVLGTGSPFITPIISSPTTFYVSASSAGTNFSGGITNSTGADGGLNATDAGLIFDATQSFSLLSVKMYPQAAGSITFGAFTSAGAAIPGCQTTVVFAAAAPTGIVVPTPGWNIPVGTSHRILLTANPSSISIWREFSTTTFPYTLGTVGSITNGWLGGIFPGFYYYFFDWQITTSCESTRTPVLANVTAPPVFTSVSPAAGSPRTICSGTSATLNAVGGGYTNYTWNPGALPNPSVVSPLVTTTYTLTADIPGGCRRDSVVTIIVNSAPTPIVVTPNSASVCPNFSTPITVTGGLINGQNIFAEMAEIFPLTQFTVTTAAPFVTAAQNTTYFQQGTSSVWLTHGDFSDGALAMTNPINLTGFTNPKLTFYQIAGLEANASFHYDAGFVEYSIDGGTNYIKFPTSSYVGTGSLIGGFVGFDNTSYPDWDAQFATAASTPGAAPATSLWKLETIDLSPWAGQASFKVRFHIVSDVNQRWYGWLIDNINITGTGQAPITWSSAANLYITSTGTGSPYVLGTDHPNVWYNAPSTAPLTYTATATSGVGVTCTATATTTLSASALTSSVSIASSPLAPVCAGVPVTYTATAVNGGAPPGYEWFVNGASQGPSVVGANVFSYTAATSYTIYCIMSINPNVGGCASGTRNSNTISMTVNPKPVANPISGSASVCNGTPNILTETTASSITTYQWLLNGSPAAGSTNSSTFSSIQPGTYNIALLGTNGCRDTSANLVVVRPVYTITVNAGPNGSINPSGPVLVNCGDTPPVFNIVPNSGYSILDVSINGVTNATAISTGNYTFAPIRGDSTISATFFIVGCASPATSNAGPDASVCAHSNFSLSGTRTIGGAATSGTWTSSGTGLFIPNNTFAGATSYTPSAADSAAGTVNLTLTTDDPPGVCPQSSSTLTLTIKPTPAVVITGRIGICNAGQTTTYLVADTSATTVNISAFAWIHGGPVGTNNDSLFVAATLTGSYTVNVTGVNGCTGTNTVTVNYFTPPTVTISGTGPICTDAGIDINSTAVAGSGTVLSNGYSWYLTVPGPTTTLVGGATSSILTASAAGSYTAYATNSNGCVSTSASNSVVLGIDNSPLNGNYTIGVGPASCTNYISFARAIADLNSRSISGNVRFSVPAGYVETVPKPGLILGGKLVAGVPILNNATNGGLTISFLKSGAGANPKLIGFTLGGGLPTTAIPDGIFKLRGVDNVSIIEIDLAENPSNTGSDLMDFGYGLFRYSATDGAQNNLIQGCKITLNKANDLSAAGLMSEGATGIVVIGAVDSNAINPTIPSSTLGTNSNNKFYSNTIDNCHNGIWLSGYAAASPYTLGDTGNDVGGTSSVTGNTITNFGTTSDFTPPSAIKATNQWGLNISFNTIVNNNGSGTNTTNNLRGIYATASIGASATYSNNSITLTSSATSTNNIAGIDNAAGASGSGNTLTINSNTITGSSNISATASWTGILNSATATTANISGNTIQNITMSGSGDFKAVNNTAVVSTLNVNNNNVRGNTKSGVGKMDCISIGSPLVANIVSNVVSNNTIAGGGTNCLLDCIIGAGSTGATYVLDGNTMYNNSITNMTLGFTGTIYGFYNNSSPGTETITDNVVRKLFVTGAAGNTGLHVIRGLFANTVAASTRSYLRNQIDSLYSNAAASAAITGIWSQVGGTVTIADNKIHSLFPGQSSTAGAIAKGINIQAGTTVVKVYNNMISLDLSQAFAPAANNVLTGINAVSGIEVSANSIPNLIYYNTIRLAGGGSGTTFGSSGISLVLNSAGQSNDMRNNIVSNFMIAGGGTGLTTALRRTSTTFGNYPTTSNNNLWYTTETATTPLYFNGTTAYATLALFKANVSTRETVSLDDLPDFVNTALNDLHLKPTNCALDGAAQPIAGYLDDYDGTLRDINAPDIGCHEIDGTGGSGIWKGVNTNWMDPRNWCGVVPTVTTDVTIPVKLSGIYPIITTTAPVCRNITINATATLTIDVTGQLSNKGVWLNNGTITNNGTIELNGTTNQLFPNVAGTGTLAAMTNLYVNNPAGATIDKPIVLYGVLKPKNGAITLNNVLVTLHSDPSGTASVDTVAAGASFIYTGANAKFSVERYISTVVAGVPRTAWRFLAAPITGTQTINQAWQEGAVPGTHVSTGYGMQIVGPFSAGTGFDIDNTITSLKWFAPATNTWVTVPGTSGPIASTQGYMAFIRGDRGSYQFGNTSPTTLRMSGQIKTGLVTVSTANANVSQFISVGNPYPCPIDFAASATVKTGLLDVYYVWDPKLSTYGAYQTFAGPGYVASPGGGSYAGGNKAIESGQAFLVYSNTSIATHSIAINENSKKTSNFQVARSSTIAKSFSTRMYVGADSNAILYDGNRVDFDAANSNTIDENDAIKLSNFGENIGIFRDGKAISVERRAEIVDRDTIFYKLGQLKQQDYHLEFTADNIASPALTAFLEDAYLNTSTVVDLAAVTNITFTVNADVASKATDRFRLVFRQLAPVPVSFTSITAFRLDNNVQVKWNVENELSIAHYEIEHSANGRDFSKLATQLARGNGSGITLQYGLLDVAPYIGNNFYRIKSVGNSGDVKYSNIVKVNLKGDPSQITIYPNPVNEDGIIKVSLVNQPTAAYRVRILNGAGQVVINRVINHEEGNAVYEIDLKKSAISHGNYVVQVSEGNKVKTSFKIVY